MARPGIRHVVRWMAGITAVLAAGAGVFIVNAIWFRPFSINVFYERVFIEFALKDPELLTTLRILEPLGLHFHNDDLTDASPAFARSLAAKARRDRDTLRQYDLQKQSPEQRLSTAILEWFLNNAVEGEPYLFHNYPVNQLFGVQSEFPTFMATMHTVETPRDAENYVARLDRFPRKIDQVMEGLRLREEQGILPPRFVVDRVLAEMRAFRGTPARENILYVSLLDKVKDQPDGKWEPVLERAADRIEESVYPAYDVLIAYFDAIAAKTNSDDGVWKLPDGEAFYRYCLKSETTLPLDPEDVHQQGLAEVERITGEMRAVLQSQGVDGEEPAAFLRSMAGDSSQLYPNTDEGRAACLAEYQRIMDEINGGISDIFGLRPKAGVRVERIPEFKEKTAPGAYYYPPALDGSRPGIFYANLRDMAEVPKFGMRTLAYHEGIPGHHFQFAVQQEVSGPTFRKILPFTAYAEGWALYAERLAWEYGYQDDPLSNLGRLQAELFRAVRLVVDTGIHHKRWTREQAIEYMEKTTGMPRGDVVAEIERYIVNPGQACAYKIGMMKILELRERAKTALGEKFDLRRFHDTLLQHGSVPLEVLDKIVNDFIAAGS